MKFKVGDKVRINGKTLSGRHIDTVGEIVGYDISRLPYEYCWLVRFKDNKEDNSVYFSENSLTLIRVSLPINITFKNRYEHQAVQQFLFDNGCAWGGCGKQIRDFGNNTINVQKNGRMQNYEIADAPTFTINDLETIKEILSKPIVTFELNDSYKAEIDPNTEIVKVGCQSFTFAKIKELVNKIEGK